MGISRKTWWLFAAAAVVALALAVPAFATAGDSGYMLWDSMAGANGTSPHGGYATTTQKCVVCHAVHDADLYGDVLLSSTVAGACAYCHVNATSGYVQVYGGIEANYSGADSSFDNIYGHNAWEGAGGPGATCSNCHQVHAASLMMTQNTALRTKLLKVGSPNLLSSYDALITQLPTDADSKEVAMSKWCTTCHDRSLSTPPPDYYYNVPNAGDGTYQATAHVMTTASAGPSGDNTTFGGKVAWGNSNYCSSCHTSGYGTSAWPHFTTGARMLVSAGDANDPLTPAVDPQEDGICLRCHVSGTGSGVGIDF